MAESHGVGLEDPELVMIPSSVVEKVERDRARRRRYEQSHPKRVKNKSRVKNADKPFIGWDGEGPRDAGYALFGSSAGDEICHPYLTTAECLDLILDREEAEPDAIHVWFGSNYDVSMILRELPWKQLSALKRYTQTYWNGYELEHIPGKWFQVRKDGLTAKLFDIQSFLGGSYVSALLDMGVGSEDEILHLTSEKARRSEFLFSEIDEIREYWRLELRLMPVLAESYRRAFTDAGFDVRSWHGPGALANMAMRRHGVFDAMAVSPPAVQVAARHAFAGGRFEMFRGGHIKGLIYNADLNSAYPAFARDLPNLAMGEWRHGRDYEPGKFAVYRIRYNSAASPLRPYPLFRRLRSGEVAWTNRCEGWYWSPEAELVCKDNDAEFIEAYYFDEADSADKPFAWIEEYYYRRKYLKSIGSVLELTFKLIINAVYGQLAQRTGWNKDKRTAPRSHQLEWAGYITSACRAAVFRAARLCGDSLVSIDTDGIYATRPVRGVEYGSKLGEWGADEFDEGVFFQSGIYSLKIDGEWKKGKTRGIPKGKFTAEELISAVETGTPLRLYKNQFVGYGLALNGQRDSLNTWQRIPVEVALGGNGKRYHNAERWCGKNGHCANGVHEFVPRWERQDPYETAESEPHYLPWLENDELIEGKKRNYDDVTIFDTRHLDADDEWVRDWSYAGA
jgi:hypothetical protein